MADENLSGQLVDQITANTVDLLRVAEHTNTKILSILQDLERELSVKIDKNTDPTGLSAVRLRTLLAQTKDTIKTYYGDVTNTHLKDLSGVAKATGLHIAGSVNDNVGVSLFSVAFTKEQLETLARRTMIEGRFSEEWWGRQGTDLQHRFTQQMRLGMLQGESVPDLVRRVRGTRENNFTDGIMQTSRAQAETLVRTSAIAVANMTRLESYMQNADLIKAIQWVSTLDNRTTEICIALDGKTWSLPSDQDAENYGGYTPINHDKEFPGPTAHFNCRSTQIPVLKSFEEIKGPKAWKLPQGGRADLADLFQEKLQNKGFSAEEAKNIQMDTRASMDGQVATTQGFEGWLGDKSTSFQNELLGQTAATLFRQGKLSLTDLTDQSNRPLTVDQLEAKAVGGKVPPPVIAPEAATAAATLEEIQAAEQESMDNLRAAILNDFAEARAVAAKAQAEVDAIVNKLETTETFSPEHGRLWKELKAAQTRRDNTDPLLDDALERAQKRLEVPEHDRSTTVVKSLTTSNPRRIAMEDGREIMDKIATAVAKGGEKQVVLDAAAGTLDAQGRAYYWQDTSRVYLGERSSERDALHELGHWIEHKNPDMLRRLVDFYEERTKGMPKEPMGKLMKSSDYETQVGRRTAPAYPDWLNQYMGAEYLHKGRKFASEILSKGLEYYYYEPERLILHDPELFDFLYRVLRNLDPLPRP